MEEIERGRSIPALACNLSGSQLVRRRRELAENVFAGVLRVEEIDDGYAFAFPGDEEWALGLARFVATERKCCAFFAFELVFGPEGGDILLRIKGPEGVKGFIEGELAALRP